MTPDVTPTVPDTSTPPSPEVVADTAASAPAAEAPAPPAPTPPATDPVAELTARLSALESSVSTRVGSLETGVSSLGSRVGSLENRPVVTATDQAGLRPGALVKYSYFDMFEQCEVEVLCLVAAVEAANDDAPERVRLIPVGTNATGEVPTADVELL